MARVSPVRDANRRVTYAQASGLAGLVPPRDRGARDSCPSCGEDGYKAYADHGFCFACRKVFSPVGLIAAVRDMDLADAAAWALEQLGLPPPDPAQRWARALDPPSDLALEDLGDALRTFCSAWPGWEELQLEPPVSGALAHCLGLLQLVADEAGCERWLTRCRQVMARVLAGMG